MNNKKFVINQKREFGSIITEAFTFVKRTFKLQLEFFLILVFPILLLSIVNLFFLFGEVNLVSFLNAEDIETMPLLRIFLAYSGIFISILLYSYVIISIGINYQMNGNSLPTKNAVFEFMKSNSFRYLAFFMFMVIFIIAMALLAFVFLALSPTLGLLLVFGMMLAVVYLFPIYSLIPVLYLKEGLPLLESIGQTFRLIKDNWWPTFGVLVVTNVIGSFATYILIVPIYIIMMVKMFSSPEDSLAASDGSGFWMSLLMVVSLISGIIVMTYTTSAIILKYYDLKERKDNVSLYDKINQIGNTEESMFENEGEY